VSDTTGAFFSPEGLRLVGGSCDILQRQYNSVYTRPFPSEALTNTFDFFSEPIIEGKPSCPPLTLTLEHILSAIDEMTNSPATGPDGTSSLLLKKVKLTLAHYILVSVSRSLATGQVPLSPSQALVRPIRKPGLDRSFPASFRPLALTLALFKVAERVIRKHLEDYLESHNLITDSQHGFRRHRSCLSELLCQHDTAISAMEIGANLDVVYVDYKKAFDRVDHGVVLRCLRYLGVTGRLGQWCAAFLVGRGRRAL
jgi:hypothetical protein